MTFESYSQVRLYVADLFVDICKTAAWFSKFSVYVDHFSLLMMLFLYLVKWNISLKQHRYISEAFQTSNGLSAAGLTLSLFLGVVVVGLLCLNPLG